MPNEGRRIAISDTHGCGDTLEKLLTDQIALSQEDTLYLLGDFIDSGPKSKKVIDLIINYQDNGWPVYCLRGNHEELMLKALHNASYHDLWAGANGGSTTLRSFDANTVLEIPEFYLRFFQNLDYYFSLPDYLLVHAGFNFKAPDPFQDYESMVWIRNFPVDPEQTHNRRIIHGHTPIPFRYIKQAIQEGDPHINIDNGCAYPKEGLQGLVALDLDNWTLWRQPNVEV